MSLTPYYAPTLILMPCSPKVCITADEDLQIETFCNLLKLILRLKLINFHYVEIEVPSNIFLIDLCLGFISKPGIVGFNSKAKSLIL